MIAELAIANAAFQVIKNTLANGGALLSAGKAVGEYFGAEKAIAKQVSEGTGNALEAFQAKEQLARQEEQLKYLLNKSRLQGYSDFVQFKAKYTRDLREAEKLEARKRHARNKAVQENVSILLKVFSALLLVMAALFGVALYLR